MEYSNSVIYAAELIGTIAFASSGALVGIRKNMDLLGVIVLAMTTALGGGLLRDVVLGIRPPKMFINATYAMLATGTACILFALIYINKYLLESRFIDKYERIMNFLDAVGLGVFTAVGINTAIAVGMGNNCFLLAFVGVMTGVGGGLVRDILAGLTPSILVEQIYATASIIGAVVYILLLPLVPQAVAVLICTTLIVALRMLAVRFGWHLPKIQ